MDNIEITRALEAEKNYLCMIRSLKTDDRFRRYTEAMKRRFEATIRLFDVTDADSLKELSELKGVRKTYMHELGMINNAEIRIKEIDAELSVINKKVKTNKGKDGAHGAIPPKG